MRLFRMTYQFQGKVSSVSLPFRECLTRIKYLYTSDGILSWAYIEYVEGAQYALVRRYERKREYFGAPWQWVCVVRGKMPAWASGVYPRKETPNFYRELPPQEVEISEDLAVNPTIDPYGGMTYEQIRRWRGIELEQERLSLEKRLERIRRFSQLPPKTRACLKRRRFEKNMKQRRKALGLERRRVSGRSMHLRGSYVEDINQSTLYERLRFDLPDGPVCAGSAFMLTGAGEVPGSTKPSFVHDPSWVRRKELGAYSQVGRSGRVPPHGQGWKSWNKITK